MYLNGLSY